MHDAAQAKAALLRERGFVVGIVGAFWPVWMWYVVRVTDRSDEPWGLLALATAAIFLVLWSGTWRLVKALAPDSAMPVSVPGPAVESVAPDAAARSSWQPVAGLVILSVYIATFHMAPHLVQAVLAILAVWLLLGVRSSLGANAGLLGLMLLALPVIPSLNFYAGYPVRLLISGGASFLVRCLGIPAVQQGTMLYVGEKLIAIDAPCSGINMLWAEAYVAMVVSCILRLTWSRTVFLAGLVAVLVPAANSLRAAALIVFDSMAPGIGGLYNQLEPTVHMSIGLFTFVIATVGILFAATLASRKLLPSPNGHSAAVEPATRTCVPPTPVPLHAASPGCTGSGRTPGLVLWHQRRTFSSAYLLPVLLLSLVAALEPFVVQASPKERSVISTSQWPCEVNGEQLIPVESAPEEEAFATGFPGQMKRFRQGDNCIFVRRVDRETRQLHPSSDCFRGAGYDIEPRPLLVFADRTKWSSFQAFRKDRRYLVMERIYDNAGSSWTDTSEWFWAASFGKTHAPWWVITIAQPLP